MSRVLRSRYAEASLDVHELGVEDERRVWRDRRRQTCGPVRDIGRACQFRPLSHRHLRKRLVKRYKHDTSYNYKYTTKSKSNLKEIVWKDKKTIIKTSDHLTHSNLKLERLPTVHTTIELLPCKTQEYY